MGAEAENSNDRVRLTPDQMDAVRAADEAYERGEAQTPDQVRESARKKTQEWIKNPRQAG